MGTNLSQRMFTKSITSSVAMPTPMRAQKIIAAVALLLVAAESITCYGDVPIEGFSLKRLVMSTQKCGAALGSLKDGGRARKKLKAHSLPGLLGPIGRFYYCDASWENVPLIKRRLFAAEIMRSLVGMP